MYIPRKAIWLWTNTTTKVGPWDVIVLPQLQMYTITTTMLTCCPFGHVVISQITFHRIYKRFARGPFFLVNWLVNQTPPTLGAFFVYNQEIHLVLVACDVTAMNNTALDCSQKTLPMKAEPGWPWMTSKHTTVYTCTLRDARSEHSTNEPTFSEFWQLTFHGPACLVCTGHIWTSVIDWSSTLSLVCRTGSVYAVHTSWE